MNYICFSLNIKNIFLSLLKTQFDSGAFPYESHESNTIVKANNKRIYNMANAFKAIESLRSLKPFHLLRKFKHKLNKNEFI
jgi:hypothetical protein